VTYYIKKAIGLEKRALWDEYEPGRWKCTMCGYKLSGLYLAENLPRKCPKCKRKIYGYIEIG